MKHGQGTFQQVLDKVLAIMDKQFGVDRFVSHKILAG
jgi:hypothetical protein